MYLTIDLYIGGHTALIFFAEDRLQTEAMPEVEATGKSNVDCAAVSDMIVEDQQQGLSNAESCSTVLEGDSPEFEPSPCYIARSDQVLHSFTSFQGPHSFLRSFFAAAVAALMFNSDESDQSICDTLYLFSGLSKTVQGAFVYARK